MACERKFNESEATTGFFLLLGQQGNKAVLDWVMKEGLIPSRYECPKCKKDMRLVERKGTIDGFEWRCRVQSKENPHFVCRSHGHGAPPATDQEKCESMKRLGDEILLNYDRLSFLDLALARMRIGTSRKTQDDFDHITLQIEGQKKTLEHQTGLLLSIGSCPLPDCLYHRNFNATQIVKKNEEEALKLQLLLANSISNVNTNLNSKTDELKTKKSTRNEGFTSPTKVAKKQKILANYSVGVDAVNVQNKFKALAGSSAMPDSEITRKWPKSRSKLSGEYLKILASTADEHREITAFLKEKGEEFHAINPIEVRPQKVVIKGLPISTDINAIRDDLTERGFNVIKVAQLTRSKSKFKLPIFMVELKEAPAPDIFQLETCCFLSVKIDSFNRRPGATQCYNCNLFHHSSSNCNIKTRCLKCGEPHRTGDCPIKTKIENPTCINCQQKDTWQTRTAVRSFPNPSQKREKPPKIEMPWRRFHHLRRFFNAHHTSWRCRRNDNRGNIIKNLIDSTDTQIVAPTTPTRFGHNSASIIDFALTRNIHWLSQVESIAELSSDHNPLIISFDTNRRFAFPRRIVTTDWAAFRELLSPAHYTFHPITTRTGEDVETQVADLTDAIINTHALSSKPIRGRNSYYVSDEIRQLMIERNRARKTWQFKAFQNKIWEDELRALDPDDGSLWEMSKELRKKKSPVYALNGQGGIAHTDSDKAEVIACSLEKQFQENNITHTSDYLINRVVENYFLNENNFDAPPLPPPMPSEVLNYIKKAQIRRAPGREGITNKILRNLTLPVIFQITNIISNIFITGHFPDSWKHASVIQY
ncbi:probable RNA-directed DNA polymerase from transposon BS [Trichonephila clavipes]|nr:probable RNA-directed DNA polymerase from transposon BS [Trichonephila clavipes]